MNQKQKRGQTLLEVVVALGLFALAVGTVFTLLGNQFKNLEIVQGGVRAIAFAEEGLEAARAIRDRSWAELTTGPHGLAISDNRWVFKDISDTEDGFTRSLVVTELQSNERLITSTVSWTSGILRPQSIVLSTVLSNWRNLVSLRLSGDWQHPRTLGSIDLGPGKVGTSLAVRNHLVYLTVYASDSRKPDFYIVDATDGTNPFIRGYLHTGPGLNSIAIAGDFSYVANRSSSSQLQIIDIANVDNPFIVSSLTLPGNNEQGVGVAVSGQYAFVGTKKSGGSEFFVVDVLDPVHPAIRGSLEIGDDINDIFVFGDRVFLATAKNSGEFMVINATDPANPAQTAAIDILGDSEDGRGIYINNQDNRAYLVRSVGGDHETHHEIAIIDVNNVDAPSLLGSLNFPADVNSVFAADNLAFFATGYPNEEFQIFEVSDPSNITPYAYLNFPQSANDIAFENNTVYVSVRSNDALRIITSQ